MLAQEGRIPKNQNKVKINLELENILQKDIEMLYHSLN